MWARSLNPWVSYSNAEVIEDVAQYVARGVNRPAPQPHHFPLVLVDLRLHLPFW
jgi:hypothetical protein